MDKLILASKSAGRKAVLSSAGIPFDVQVSHVDEDVIKRTCHAADDGLGKIALKLAEAKALKVSKEHDGLVIGADQILGLDDVGYDKPATFEEAQQRLKIFSGKTHYLHNGLCVAKAGEIIWQYENAPALTMRILTDHEISDYLAACPPEVLGAVGAYHLEGIGVRLFEKIEGDYFSILGLPLLPLLDFLRTRLSLPF